MAHQTLTMSVTLIEEQLRAARQLVDRMSAHLLLLETSLSRSARALTETRNECRQVLDAIDSGDVDRMAALARSIHTSRRTVARPSGD